MVLPHGNEQDFLRLKDEVLDRIDSLRNAVVRYSWSDVQLECRSGSLREFLQVSRGILLNAMAGNLYELYLCRLTSFAITERQYRPLTWQEKHELRKIIEEGKNAKSAIIYDMALKLQRRPQIFATLEQARVMSTVASLTAALCEP